MRIRLVLLAAAFAAAAFGAPPALAQSPCVYEGREVPHGTRVGGLVCDDGQWVGG